MKIEEAVFREWDAEFAGYCKECDEQTNWGVEPDAEGYRCEECGKKSVMGMAQALIMGFVSIK